MKHLPAVLAVSMSLIGCVADNDGEGGGFLEGLRPAKPSIDDPKAPVVEVNSAIQFVLHTGVPTKGDVIRTPDGVEVSAEAIAVPFPIDGLCIACDDVVVLRDARAPGELHVIDDVGNFFCRIWVADDGHLLTTDCR